MKVNRKTLNILEPIFVGIAAFCFGMFAINFIQVIKVKNGQSASQSPRKQFYEFRSISVGILPSENLKKRYDHKKK